MSEEHVAACREASRQLVRELGFLQDWYEPARLTHGQCHIMIELTQRGLLGISELAELLQLDKSVVSRAVKQLRERDLIAVTEHATDRRQKPLCLTDSGQALVAGIHASAGSQVAAALDLLRPEQVSTVVAGLSLYTQALRRLRSCRGLQVRPITGADNPGVARLIRVVMPEFGADGPGFAIHDPEVEDMAGSYTGPGSGYLVVERDGQVLGGAGFGPLAGGPSDTCELRKMYFLPEIRGLGLGQQLLREVLGKAREAGYARCYLETLGSMARARRLYQAFGFQRLPGPLGSTGHYGCNAWYALDLSGWRPNSSPNP